MMMKKIIVAALLTVSSCAVFGQSAIVRGEASAGVYENIKSTSQALNVTVSSTAAPAGMFHFYVSVSVALTSTLIITGNNGRRYLQIQNQDATNPIWVRCDAAAATADGNSIKIAAGQTWAPVGVPTGSCNGIATGAPVVTNMTYGQ